MSDEKLRLIAEVRDNMSSALRKIKDPLSAICASPSMKAATAEMQILGAATSKFAGFGGGAASALDAIGIGGLSLPNSCVIWVMKKSAKVHCLMDVLPRRPRHCAPTGGCEHTRFEWATARETTTTTPSARHGVS